MKGHMILKEKEAQTAVEYMLLLMAVVTIVIIGFQTYLPYIEDASNTYYNRAVPGILGDAPRCGDGIMQPYPLESCEKCPKDYGAC